MTGSDLERRLLDIERTFWALSPDWRGLGGRLVALEQQLAQLWSAAGMLSTPTTTPTPTPTPISGGVRGCNASNPGAGLAVSIRDDGGATLWSGLTDASGNYAGSIPLVGASPVRTAVTVTPLSATQATTTGNFEAISPGVAHSYATINLSAAEDYTCSAVCGLPIRRALALTAGGACAGSSFPDDTLTYQSSPPPWAAGLVVGGGWLGASPFELPTIDPGHTYLYWFQRDGTLSALRQAPSPLIRTLALPSSRRNCGDSFSTSYLCGVGASINAVISG